MAKATLVGPDIELGSEIVRLLDGAGFPATVALWLFKSDIGEWEFTVGTPLYEKAPPGEAYGRLRAALAPLGPQVLHELRIRLLGHKAPLIRGLRRAYGKDDSIPGTRLGGPAPGSDVWIEDSYVYRIK